MCCGNIAVRPFFRFFPIVAFMTTNSRNRPQGQPEIHINFTPTSLNAVRLTTLMTLQKLPNYNPVLRGVEKFSCLAAFHRRVRAFRSGGILPDAPVKATFNRGFARVRNHP
jgi:hypothetical protein